MKNDSTYDDVTGLAAFDDLDPVSAVSELSQTPEYPAAYQPVAQYHPGADTALPSTMPPPITSTRPYTDPPPAAYGHDPYAAAYAGEYALDPRVPVAGPGADGTMQFSPAELDGATEIGDDFAVAGGHPGGAAQLQMEWDDDEMETRIHHGVDAPEWNSEVPYLHSSPPMVGHTLVPGGAPSPFPMQGAALAQHPQMLPPAQFGQTAPGLPGLPPPPRAPSGGAASPQARGAAGTPVSEDQLVDLPSPESRWGARMALLFTVVFVCAGTLWAAHNILTSPEATITLATTPADAEVSLDGEPLAGQTSPYVLNVIADEEHALVVRKTGYEPFKMSLKASKGENKALPQIELKRLQAEVGFSINSRPSGAKVFVDGADSGQVTPARVIDVASGTHTVKLASDGYRPFEIQVFVPESQVVELPEAELEPGRMKVAAAGRPPSVERSRERVQAEPERRAPAARVNRHGAAQRTHRGTPAKSTAPTMRASRSTKRVSGGASRSRFNARAGSSPRRAPSASTRRPLAGARATRSARPAGASPFGTPKGQASKPMASGTLRLNSRPWAQIAIDGRPVGNTPQLNLKVPAGAHTIKFSNPEMGLTKTIKLRVAKGKTETRVINLIE